MRVNPYLQQTNGWKDKLFLLLVVDINPLSNGLQVISEFIFRRKNGRKKNKKGVTEEILSPPVTNSKIR